MSSPGIQKLLQYLEREGVLLEADPNLPSVATMIAGTPIRGSWWGHPNGKIIYNASSDLHEYPDILAIKLISGKVTFIHRNLWSELIAIATSKEEWQMTGLSSEAKNLYKRVESDGILRTDKLPRSKEKKSVGDLSRELEGRLLVYGSSIHTEAGAHAKQLESWRHFARGKKIDSSSMNPTKAMARFDSMISSLNHQFDAKAWLPWQKRASR